ncbi:MAG: pyridoxamine 5'-phosphate oxidase family protein [Alphaproteobacteria bacterium]
MTGGRDGPVETLDGVLDLAWTALIDGAAGRLSAMRRPVLATVDRTGRPRARTVILRAADRGAWRLRFHTDLRSSKASEMRDNNWISLVFYEPTLDLQVRVEGPAALHAGDAAARAAWDDAAPSSRRIHLAEPGPGADIAAPGSGLPAGLDTRVPTGAEAEPGYRHFAAVVVAVDLLDVYQLHPAGHRRSTHRHSGDGGVAARWRVP